MAVLVSTGNHSALSTLAAVGVEQIILVQVALEALAVVALAVDYLP
jgi:hypothetical protein